MSGFVLFKTLLAATALVNVDVGRQLFVDDALVETTTLKRVWHHPVKFEGNPVMKPEMATAEGQTTVVGL